MIKRNKKTLVITSLIILLPMILGVIMWDLLPGLYVTHWGADGAADGWGGKAIPVFAMPLIMLALHWLCLFVTMKDPKNKDQTKTAESMALWICPFISVFVSGVMYASAVDSSFGPERITPAFIGIMFLVMGNYLPKIKQNHTLGIKLPWTLFSEDNWNRTHRFAGKMWVAGGLAIVISIFLPEMVMVAVMVFAVVILAVVPMVYSYMLHRKAVKNGETDVRTADIPMGRSWSVISKISLAIVAVILVAVVVLMFTGDIEVSFREESFKIEADYWSDLVVYYSAVESMEYVEKDDVGIRTSGFGSARLQMGNFRSDMHGSYVRYAYTACDSAVVVKAGAGSVVISGKDDAATYEIYEELLERTGLS